MKTGLFLLNTQLQWFPVHVSVICRSAQLSKKGRSEVIFSTSHEQKQSDLLKITKFFLLLLLFQKPEHTASKRVSCPKPLGMSRSICTGNGGREMPPALVCLPPHCPSSLVDDKEGKKPQVLHFLVPWTLGQAEGISEPLLRIMFFSA